MKSGGPHPLSRRKSIRIDLPNIPSEGGPPKQYKLSNLNQCPQLKAQVTDAAILRVLGNMCKSLLAVERKEFDKDRTRIDIPHELFGLRLEDFYARRQQTSTLYLDLLRMVCPGAIERTKFCIVLDDLRGFVNKLTNGYKDENLTPVYQRIAEAVKLLTINEEIIDEYTKNKSALEALENDLDRFGKREKIAGDFLTNLVYDGMNHCAEAVLVLHPIEFRYKVNYHNRAFQTLEEGLTAAEEDLRRTSIEYAWKARKDEYASDDLRMKQLVNIEVLKGRLLAMNKQFERDSDYLNEQITYKKNSIEAIHIKRRNLMEKEIWMDEEMVKLREWYAKKKEEEHKEAVRIIMNVSEKKKKRKRKSLKKTDIKKDVVKEP